MAGPDKVVSRVRRVDAQSRSGRDHRERDARRGGRNFNDYGAGVQHLVDWHTKGLLSPDGCYTRELLIHYAAQVGMLAVDYVHSKLCYRLKPAIPEYRLPERFPAKFGPLHHTVTVREEGEDS